jgi:hypothetical protein
MRRKGIANLLARLAKPKRILKGRQIVEFCARVEQADFDYLEQLRAERGQARSRALTQVLREHKELAGRNLAPSRF